MHVFAVIRSIYVELKQELRLSQTDSQCSRFGGGV